MNPLVSQLFLVFLPIEVADSSKVTAYVHQPLIVHYFSVSRVYPAAQEVRWKQQFY